MSNFICNEIDKTIEGKYFLDVSNTYGYCRGVNVTAEDIAEAMTTADMERLLDVCGGDFSQLDTNTAKAISIKATLLLEKREERAKKQAECRKQQREALHNCIVDEIRTLCGDSPCFTATQIQLLAAQNGLPVRTRQMYSSHLSRAYSDGIVIPVYESYKTVHVIYANGKSGTQDIRQKGGYKFN